ncbi:MAG TPA: hypothetical protein VN611_01635 [Patescibacteria group bacterium]|nr:hypothetical protein [Patescibacteria group bacterium]
MSESMRPWNKNEAEELSRLLDEINAGRQPDCTDNALSELASIADWIQQNADPVPPPQYLLNQIVDKTLSESFTSTQKRRRFWLYSGSLGTVAAVLVVAALNLLPASPEEILPPPTSPQTSPASTVPAFVEATTVPDTKAPASAAKAPSAAATSPAQDTAPSHLVLPPPASTFPPPELSSSAPPTPEHRKVMAPDVAPGITAAPPRTIQEAPLPSLKANKFLALSENSRRSVALPPDSLTVSTGPAPLAVEEPTLTPLVLPGQTPDLVVTDPATGQIVQTYFRGTQQEVTIIQQHLTTTADKSLPSPSSGSSKDTSSLHQVTITLGNQQITIEGCQSPQELEQLARSLTTKPSR